MAARRGSYILQLTSYSLQLTRELWQAKILVAWLAETEEPNSTADTERTPRARPAARAPPSGLAPPSGWAWLAAAVQVILELVLESRKGGKCPIPFFECQAAYIAEAWARPPDAALTTQAEREAWVSARLATVAASG